MALHMKRTTPVRRALKADSHLQPRVEDGIGAMKRAHRGCLATEVRTCFGDSLDLDEGLSQDHPEENRWDYLLGLSTSREVVGLEPHSAKTGEISTVIRKRTAAKEQLAAHLRSDARVSKWLWVASGKNHFADTEKAVLQLAQNGIQFVSGRVLAKHLSEPMSKGKRG